MNPPQTIYRSWDAWYEGAEGKFELFFGLEAVPDGGFFVVKSMKFSNWALVVPDSHGSFELLAFRQGLHQTAPRFPNIAQAIAAYKD